ncbi:class E sortase [Candidatus Contubernalis alkaliaceticus]|uniref:class E sortase n=1 Tax=Candidatus Contubernalis alkaliaceticus TaxID=338645 RepID=UPI001F4C0681|nr:class E sortase [Candidatus Contubernalis alkalaceticus]UNC93459.1 class E sortase [Candidatus Contubernalis alkalaceticus]
MPDNNKVSNNSRIKKLPRPPGYWIGALLIIVGVSLVLFPFLKNSYEQYILTSKARDTIEQIKKESPLILPEENSRDNFPEQLLPKEAVLEIPTLNLIVNINYGIETEDFEHIPSFYPQSGYPMTGNVSIAGHRNAKNFRYVDELVKNDEIRLYYDNKLFLYYVDEVFLTHERDWSIIEPTETAALTLTTCDPPGSDPTDQRLIVRAYLSDSIELKD